MRWRFVGQGVHTRAAVGHSGSDVELSASDDCENGQIDVSFLLEAALDKVGLNEDAAAVASVAIQGGNLEACVTVCCGRGVLATRVAQSRAASARFDGNDVWLTYAMSAPLILRKILESVWGAPDYKVDAFTFGDSSSMTLGRVHGCTGSCCVVAKCAVRSA